LRAEQNWAQNSGAKRRDDINCVSIFIFLVALAAWAVVRDAMKTGSPGLF